MRAEPGAPQVNLCRGPTTTPETFAGLGPAIDRRAWARGPCLGSRQPAGGPLMELRRPRNSPRVRHLVLGSG